MAKREISSTLKNLKFMQRAAQRMEKTQKQEEIKPDGNFFPPGTTRRCAVIMEGDPQPGAVIGRMSFQSFNPSVDKLNNEAANFHSHEASDTNATSSSGRSGRTSVRENGLKSDGAECLSNDEPQCRPNGNLKRKHSESVSDSEKQNQNKSSKTVHGGQQSSDSSPSTSRGSFKQPKPGKLDWSVLRPRSQSNQKN